MYVCMYVCVCVCACVCVCVCSHSMSINCKVTSVGNKLLQLRLEYMPINKWQK